MHLRPVVAAEVVVNVALGDDAPRLDQRLLRREDLRVRAGRKPAPA